MADQAEMRRENIYFIDDSYETKDPECVKIPVEKLTEKLVYIKGTHKAAHYVSRVKRESANWTALEAWEKYRQNLSRQIEGIEESLENRTKALESAKEAIKVLEQAVT